MLDPSPDVTSSTYKRQQLPAAFFLKMLSGPCIVEQTGENRELIPQDRPSNDDEWKLVDKYPSTFLLVTQFQSRSCTEGP